VHLGDLVLATDEVSGTTSLQPVTGTSVVENAALMEVSIVHSDGQEEILQVTDDHPFWVEMNGTANCTGELESPRNDWQRADGLHTGDLLRSMGGTALVQTVLFTQHRTTVYNLAVAGTSTYHAGEHGVWVHNCKVVKHHLIPAFRKTFHCRTISVDATLTPTIVQLKLMKNSTRQFIPFGTLNGRILWQRILMHQEKRYSCLCMTCGSDSIFRMST
jgi:hypothetical protein